MTNIKHLCNIFCILCAPLVLRWSMNELVALIGQGVIMGGKKRWELKAVSLWASDWRTVKVPGQNR